MFCRIDSQDIICRDMDGIYSGGDILMKGLLIIYGILLILIGIGIGFGIEHSIIDHTYYIEGDNTVDTFKEINEYCDLKLDFQRVKLKNECENE